MSLATALASVSIQTSSLQQVQSLMNEIERDIRHCLQQVGQRPVAESNQACKDIGKKIAGIEASLPAVKPDEETRESFHDLTSDLRCLSARIAIAARKTEGPNAPVICDAGNDLYAAKWQRMANKLAVKERRECVRSLREWQLDRLSSVSSQSCKFPTLVQKLGKIPYTPIPKPGQLFKYQEFGVYVTSNEFGQKRVRDLLKTIKKIPGGVHLGMSGLYNWDLIAHMKSSFAVLVDFNPKVAAFHRKMLDILAGASSREDFFKKACAQITQDLNANRNYYRSNVLFMFENAPHTKYNPLWYQFAPLNERIHLELSVMMDKEGSALSEEQFPILQKMAREGRIVPLHLDFCDTQGMKAIADAVHEEGLVFSSLYLSNSYDYLEHDPEGRKAFKSNVDLLKQDDTCIIDTSYLGFGALKLQSFLHYGKDPATGKPYDPDISRGWLMRKQGGGSWADTNKVDTAAYYQQPEPLKEHEGDGFVQV